MSIRLALAAALAFAAPALVPTLASADETFSITCTSSRQVGDATTCNRSATYQFQSFGPEQRFGLELTAPAAHCSQVQYRVLDADTRAFLGTTRFLNPGETQLAEIGDGFPEGVNRVAIVAWGKVGGCNTGRLGSWGVSVHPVLMR